MFSAKFIRMLMLCSQLFVHVNAWSITFVLPTKGDLVGELQYANPEIGETLSDVGIRYDIGYDEMVRANPRVDPERPLSTEVRLLIPSRFILPAAPRKGLVINLAEYRLYYYPPDDNVVITMPVGIGREGWTTPIGLTKVIAKQRDPVWRPTDNVMAAAEKKGMPIPNAFPPGEGNPLGRHILRLGWSTYLIHGTNRRDGVGTRISAGCIRMMPEDIEYLYDLVAVGTPVRVVNAPVKIGRSGGALYMQVHPALIEQKNTDLTKIAQEQLAMMRVARINNKLLNQELSYPTGLAKKISG
ncbi:putative L,D-transpeptidase YnhG precursor [Legionella massiliensis]|uniref:Putative L,D-transpeptidase YnhG n=1 Tax=Legionella massiliensis TaxID=1034943 RepID=A0A078KUW8_9GAMM|nr:L,D-transpeptidase family protein [Legionella massiliensis]CDZ78240.1 putative L,D-transpeptidase YnhG precursor [Legionella massiliensis]CEE13978.1 putative L,D-transpeptidase YnhG precursor [Legionella massiliensis]